MNCFASQGVEALSLTFQNLVGQPGEENERAN